MTTEAAPGIPEVACLVQESILVRFLQVARERDDIPSVLRGRLPSPLGAPQANIRLDVPLLDLSLRESDAGRVRIDVGTKGLLRWGIPLPVVTQDVRVACTIFVPVAADLEEDALVTSADYGAAQVLNTRVTLTDSTLVPGMRATDFLGPGRRVLDAFVEQLVQAQVRRYGLRRGRLAGPIPRWLHEVGVPVGPLSVTVSDGAIVVATSENAPLPDASDAADFAVAAADDVLTPIAAELVGGRLGPVLGSHNAVLEVEHVRPVDSSTVHFGLVLSWIRRLRHRPRSLATRGTLAASYHHTAAADEFTMRPTGLSLDDGPNLLRRLVARVASPLLARRAPTIRASTRWKVPHPGSPDAPTWAVRLGSMSSGGGRVRLDFLASPSDDDAGSGPPPSTTRSTMRSTPDDAASDDLSKERT